MEAARVAEAEAAAEDDANQVTIKYLIDYSKENQVTHDLIYLHKITVIDCSRGR